MFIIRNEWLSAWRRFWQQIWQRPGAQYNEGMPIPPSDEPLYTVAEVAIELGISHRRVNALIAAKRLPAQLSPKGDWLIRESDIDLVRDRRPGNPNHRKNST